MFPGKKTKFGLMLFEKVSKLKKKLQSGQNIGIEPVSSIKEGIKIK